MNIQIIRATETWQQAGAYYVRIQGMARQHGITLRREFDEHDTPQTKYIVLTDDDFPVATCRFYPLDPRSAMIGRVVVLPEYRGRGLGTTVVREAEQWIRELGFATAVVESRDNAVAFYEKLGYTVTDSTVIHGDTFDCIRMEKALAAGDAMKKSSEPERKMGTIKIQKTSITDLDTDAVVNAANMQLWAGGGVCGAIFRAAGYEQLQAACSRIGHCNIGSAVITPGFDLKAKYIIHAVGPIWEGGSFGEPELLYGAYTAALELAADHACRSIGFPLISAGTYGYPVPLAWKLALAACRDFPDRRPDADLEIVFAVLDDKILEIGNQLLSEQ